MQGSNKRFTLLESLGAVYKCEDTATGELVAMKRMNIESADKGVPGMIIREVSILRELDHPNVVKLLDVELVTERKLQLVFEFLHQDLKRMMDRQSSPLAGRQLKSFVYQLLDGINACHAKRIVHRDLKPRNILVSRDETTVKLADFALGRVFQIPSRTYTHEVVTMWYRAPEILLGERHYTAAVDIWSIGCIMAEMATGRALFPGECEIHQLYLIFEALGTPSEALWEGVSVLPEYKATFPQWRHGNLQDRVPTLDPLGIDLLSQLLMYSPRDRISAAKAMRHRWFDDIRGELCDLPAD